MKRVYVTGTGLHPFGRFDGKSLTELGVTAVRAALAEAGVGRGGFQAAFCGSVYGGVASGHKVLTALGLSGVLIVNVEAGCASGGAALALGAAQIAMGRYDTVLVLGLEKMPRGMIRSSLLRAVARGSRPRRHARLLRAPRPAPHARERRPPETSRASPSPITTTASTIRTPCIASR